MIYENGGFGSASVDTTVYFTRKENPKHTHDLIV